MKSVKTPVFKPVVQTLFLTGSIALTASSSAMAAEYGLKDVYQMALSYDAKIAQAQAQFDADKQAVDTAMAPLLPQVKADGSYFVTDSNIDSSDVTSQDLSVTLNQSIYDHANWSRYEQSKYSFDAANSVLQSAKQDLILRVAQNYFDVLLAQQNLLLSKNKEAADFTQYETAEASAELGLSSKVDVLQAKSNYDLSKSETINAENRLDIALENLANITGQSMADIKSKGLKALLPDVELPAINLNEVALEAKAKLNNLQVKSAQSQLGSAIEEIEVKKSGHYPTVNFQAKYSDTDYSDFESGSLFTDSEKTQVGVSISLPIYSGGGTSSQVTAAKHKALAAQQALRDSQDTAKLNMRTQIRNLERGEKLISALREAVKSNDAFLESAEEGYKVGLQSMLEVLTARTNQTNAQKNLLEAIHNQVLSHFNLEATLGDLTFEDVALYEPLLQSKMH